MYEPRQRKLLALHAGKPRTRISYAKIKVLVKQEVKFAIYKLEDEVKRTLRGKAYNRAMRKVRVIKNIEGLPSGIIRCQHRYEWERKTLMKLANQLKSESHDEIKPRFKILLQQTEPPRFKNFQREASVAAQQITRMTKTREPGSTRMTIDSIHSSASLPPGKESKQHVIRMANLMQRGARKRVDWIINERERYEEFKKHELHREMREREKDKGEIHVEVGKSAGLTVKMDKVMYQQEMLKTMEKDETYGEVTKTQKTLLTETNARLQKWPKG
jgi:hypothetical protein